MKITFTCGNITVRHPETAREPNTVMYANSAKINWQTSAALVFQKRLRASGVEMAEQNVGRSPIVRVLSRCMKIL